MQIIESVNSYYMARSSHPPRLDYSNYTGRRLQIMKIFVNRNGYHKHKNNNVSVE
jgi:hypothetical protein